MNSSPDPLGSPAVREETRFRWELAAVREETRFRWELADDLDTPRDDWVTRALEMPANPNNRRTVRILGKPYHWVAGGGLKLRAGESPW